MSFSFHVRGVPALPRFADVVAGAGLVFPVELALGTPAEPWPNGAIARLSDAVSRVSPSATDPGAIAMLARLGTAPAFLVHAPGRSTRGVEVGRRRDGSATAASFRVLACASPEDYEIAVRLAASLARLTGTRVEPEHGPDGLACPPLDPAVLLQTFDAAFARKNAIEMAGGLENGGGFVLGPRGWLRLPPPGGGPEAWYERARAELLGSAPVGESSPGASERAEAELLLGAMARGAAADGRATPRELETMSKLCGVVSPLDRFGDRELETMIHAGVAALGKPPPAIAASYRPIVREKAVVLAVEVVVRGAQASFAADDANVRGLTALAAHVGVAESTAAAAIQVWRRKYIPGPIDDETRRTYLDTMLLVAAADGRVVPAELQAIASILGVVPQFEGANVPALLDSLLDGLAQRQPTLGARLDALTQFKEKVFVLASEVAWAGGPPSRPTQAVLAWLEAGLRMPTASLPIATRTILSIKYAR